MSFLKSDYKVFLSLLQLQETRQQDLSALCCQYKSISWAGTKQIFASQGKEEKEAFHW